MVMCRDCAILGVLNSRSGEVLEAPQSARDSGNYKLADGQNIPAQFICDAGIRKFPVATLPLLNSVQIQIEIGECDRFHKWRPGRSPKEVEQMIVQDEVINLRRDMLELHKTIHTWQQDQSAKGQKWEQQLQALQEVRHQESLGVGKSQAVGTNWQAIGTVIAAVTSVVALIVSFVALWNKPETLQTTINQSQPAASQMLDSMPKPAPTSD